MMADHGPSSAWRCDGAPNLLLIGAKKASTTLLYETLSLHPEIWFSAEKEPHHFLKPDYRKPAVWRQYLRLFEGRPASARFFGEASTGYTTLPHNGPTPRRIREQLGQPRMIYIVRDPVERAISNFKHSHLGGWYPDDITFGQAIELDPILLDTSCYAFQLFGYRNVFGKEAVHVVVAEEFHRAPVDVLRGIEEYLGVSRFEGWPETLPRVNSQKQLATNLLARRLLGNGRMKSLAKRILPESAKRWGSARAVSRPSPTITDAEREAALAGVADDLEQLVGMLGDRIDCWPSVQRLGARR